MLCDPLSVLSFLTSRAGEVISHYSNLHLQSLTFKLNMKIWVTSPACWNMYDTCRHLVCLYKCQAGVLLPVSVYPVTNVHAKLYILLYDVHISFPTAWLFKLNIENGGGN